MTVLTAKKDTLFVDNIFNMHFPLLVSINLLFITLTKTSLLQCLKGYFRDMYVTGIIIRDLDCQLTGGGRSLM
jgi:hypothetical protein